MKTHEGRMVAYLEPPGVSILGTGVTSSKKALEVVDRAAVGYAGGGEEG